MTIHAINNVLHSVLTVTNSKSKLKREFAGHQSHEYCERERCDELRP